MGLGARASTTVIMATIVVTMVTMMIMVMMLMFTSKILRALAPVPAVMESPSEAIIPMSTGLSWCTLRWVGG